MPLPIPPILRSLLLATLLSTGCTGDQGITEEDSSRADEIDNQTLDERIDARPEIRGYQIEMESIAAGTDDATYYFEVYLRGQLSSDHPIYDEFCGLGVLGDFDVNGGQVLLGSTLEDSQRVFSVSREQVRGCFEELLTELEKSPEQMGVNLEVRFLEDEFFGDEFVDSKWLSRETMTQGAPENLEFDRAGIRATLIATPDSP